MSKKKRAAMHMRKRPDGEETVEGSGYSPHRDFSSYHLRILSG